MSIIRDNAWQTVNLRKKKRKAKSVNFCLFPYSAVGGWVHLIIDSYFLLGTLFLRQHEEFAIFD